MKKSGIYIVGFIALLLVAGCSGGGKDEGVKCEFCKMMVKLPEQVQGAKIVFKDGTEEYYCCMAHAVMGWQLEHAPGADLTNPPVEFFAVDYEQKKLIPAEESYYVLGSDVPAKMFKKSVVAFATRQAASEFILSHGGDVMNFSTLASRNLAEMKEMKEMKDGKKHNAGH